MSGGGVSGGKPRSANGFVTRDRNELIASIPVGATPVAATPESCISAFARAAGDRVLRGRNGAGTAVGGLLSTPTIGATTGGTGPGGTGTSGVVHGAKLPAAMWLVSNVTAPLRAKALPQEMVAPVSSVMLVSARMSPTNVVAVPSVAELPTTQNTSVPCPPPTTVTFEALAVVSDDGMTKMKVELGPVALSVSVPDNRADELKL